MKTFDVVIIGAGTSGLTARRQVEKVTSNYIVVDDGPMGTTCARVGCMPSKVLIQVANDFQHSKKFKDFGLHGAENLKLNPTEVMDHVRKLRDRFVRAVKNPMSDWSDKLVQKRAKILSKHEIQIGDEIIKAKKIIIATGSSPIIPKEWLNYKENTVTTDELFELKTLPESMAVIGLGVIGLEIGQALHRLGVKTVGITMGPAIGGISDPELQKYVADKLQSEFPVHYNGVQKIEKLPNGNLKLTAENKTYEVEKVLISVGRSPNIKNIGLENLNIDLNKNGLPKINFNTLALEEAEHIFMPGDANSDRTILHEASDEGLISGYNAVHDMTKFKRRTFLAIGFMDPNIAAVGKKYSELMESKISFVTGKASFEGQGRSIIKLKEQGLLHVYVDSKSHKILGAELQAPDGEHIAHLLSWVIAMDQTVEQVLRLPFYHPVIEEGLRTALRHAESQLNNKDYLEIEKI